MKVKFTSDIGYAKKGDVENYPEEEAKKLISDGVAEAYEPTTEKPVSLEEEEKPSFISKFKGITNE